MISRVPRCLPLPLLLLLSLAAFPGRPLGAADPPAPAAAGAWHGEIELPGQAGKLAVSVDLAQAGGAWKGKIDIPAQGAQGLPLEGIAVDGAKVKFAIAAVPGAPTFDGTIAGGEIRGTFSQGGLAMPFHLERGAAEPVHRPQEPKPPFPYTAQDVAYTNGDVKLAGTLTLPPGPGPFPAALLITGSGSQDRDESLMNHKPFWVLADHLSRHGIAVLRVDDRGVGGSSGSVAKSTTADFVGDALAGVRFLKAQPKIAPNRIGLVGHSEGGLIGPLAASQSPDVAFVVMLAGTGVPGDTLLLRQVELIARAGGGTEEQVKAAVERTRRQTQAVVAEKDPAALSAILRRLAREDVAAMSEDERKAAGGADALVEAEVKAFDSPWFRYFLAYDPRPALRKVKVPVLALNGSLDLQVPPDQNLPEIDKALREAGNHDVTLRRMEGLNHLFQPAKTGSPMEYAAIETTLDPAVLDLVSGWIAERFVTPKAAPEAKAPKAP